MPRALTLAGTNKAGGDPTSPITKYREHPTTLFQMTVDTVTGRVTGRFSGETYTFLLDLEEFKSPPLPWTIIVRGHGTLEGQWNPQTHKIQGTAKVAQWNYSILRGSTETKWATPDVKADANGIAYVKKRLRWLQTMGNTGEFSGNLATSGKGSGAISFGLLQLKWETESASNDSVEPPKGPPAASARVFFLARLEADKETYVAGQRVALSLRLEKWEEKGPPERPSLSRPIGVCDWMWYELTFRFPPEAKADPVGPIMMKNHKGGKAARDFVPCAPVVPGKYVVEAKLIKHPEPADAPVRGVDQDGIARVEFNCVPPRLDQLLRVPGNMEAVVRRFKDPKKGVHSHRAAVWDEYVRRSSLYHPKGHPLYLQAIDDMEYGSWNNWYWGQSEWNCSGYQQKTVDFLSDLRFLDSDRELMVGIHYSPIVRGWGDAPGKLSGEHHGTVLYPNRRKPLAEDNLVLDPWPRQTPDVFTVKEFRLLYGLQERWDAVTGADFIRFDRTKYNWGSWSGFPTHEGPVYWNRQWEECPGYRYAPPPTVMDTIFGFDNPSPPPVPPSPGREQTQLLVRCPVALLVSNAQGERLGVVQGKLLSEILGTQLFVYPKRRDDLFWHVALPEGKYHVELTGIADGEFRLMVSRAGGTGYCYAAQIQKDRKAVLEVDSAQLGTSLTLPDGRKIEPRTSGPSGPIADMNRSPAEEQALAAVRKLGGVLVHFWRNEPGKAVVLIDCGNNRSLQDGWLACFRGFPHLQSLSLAGTTVTDDGLKHLRDLTRLEYLNLAETKITDAGLMHLRGLSRLQDVNLAGTKVTGAGVKELQRTLPKAKVHR